MNNKQRYDIMNTRKYMQDGQEKTAWTRIGVAFGPNKDGSISGMLDQLPINGEIVLQIPKTEEEIEAAKAARRGEGHHGRSFGGRGAQRGQSQPRRAEYDHGFADDDRGNGNDSGS